MSGRICSASGGAGGRAQRARLPTARGLSTTQQRERKPHYYETIGDRTFEISEPDPVGSRVSRMQKRVGHGARIAEGEACAVSRSAGRDQFRRLFVTLTYRDVDGWRVDHVRTFLRLARMWLLRRGECMRCVWVAELQARGAVHYHCCFWWPRRLRMPSPDRNGWWPHGMTQVQTARSPVGYLTKYASKGEGVRSFPKGLRLFGVCGLSDVGKVQARYWCAPQWVQRGLGIGSDLRKVVGGWCDKFSGEFLKSPWECHFVPGFGVWLSKILPKEAFA